MWMTDGWIGVLAAILFGPGVVFDYGDVGEVTPFQRIPHRFRIASAMQLRNGFVCKSGTKAVSKEKTTVSNKTVA